MSKESILKLEKLGKIALIAGSVTGTIIIIMGLQISSVIGDLNGFVGSNADLSSLNYIPFFLILVGGINITFGVVIHKITGILRIDFGNEKVQSYREAGKSYFDKITSISKKTEENDTNDDSDNPLKI